VYGTPDLETTVADLGRKLGVQPSPGGRHVGRGSRNFLLSLDTGSYLEIIGRDSEQQDFQGSLPFGLEDLEEPQLLGWAIRVSDIDEFVQKVKAGGYDPGPVAAMARQTPNGQELNWKLTESRPTTFPMLEPFLIDWGTTPHPSHTAAQGARLVAFHIDTPNPEPLTQVLATLGVSFRVDKALQPRLVAQITGPRETIVVL